MIIKKSLKLGLLNIFPKINFKEPFFKIKLGIKNQIISKMDLNVIF